jgi:hypothetical protein
MPHFCKFRKKNILLQNTKQDTTVTDLNINIIMQLFHLEQSKRLLW